MTSSLRDIIKVKFFWVNKFFRMFNMILVICGSPFTHTKEIWGFITVPLSHKLIVFSFRMKVTTNMMKNHPMMVSSIILLILLVGPSCSQPYPGSEEAPLWLTGINRELGDGLVYTANRDQGQVNSFRNPVSPPRRLTDMTIGRDSRGALGWVGGNAAWFHHNNRIKYYHVFHGNLKTASVLKDIF